MDGNVWLSIAGIVFSIAMPVTAWVIYRIVDLFSQVKNEAVNIRLTRLEACDQELSDKMEHNFEKLHEKVDRMYRMVCSGNNPNKHSNHSDGN